MSCSILNALHQFKKIRIVPVHYRPVVTIGSRNYTTQAPTQQTAGEERITEILRQKFSGATYIKVEDISGGCGSMYDIQIEAKEFKGKRTVMQHRMINEALSKEIKDMHGLRILTKASDS